MSYYGIVKDNTIVNVIVAESLEDANLLTGENCVEYTDENPIGIGWVFDGEKFVDTFTSLD